MTVWAPQVRPLRTAAGQYVLPRAACRALNPYPLAARGPVAPSVGDWVVVLAEKKEAYAIVSAGGEGVVVLELIRDVDSLFAPPADGDVGHGVDER